MTEHRAEPPTTSASTAAPQIRQQLRQQIRRPTRRQVVRNGLLGLAGAAIALRPPSAQAMALGLPLGLQLYCVRDQLKADYEGTLHKLAALGYREVEAAGFGDRTAAQVAASMRSAGLRCVSAHYAPTDLSKNLDSILAFNHTLGVDTVVCSFPVFRDPARVGGLSYTDGIRAVTADDLLYTTERLNQWGQAAQAAGLRFGYHNRTMEFMPLSNAGAGISTAFDEMMRLTDPALVTFELDCGWATVGGADPVAILERYPDRIGLLHVKDFKALGRPYTLTDSPPSAEMGQGIVDFGPIFRAARHARIRHCFVEQEDYDEPPFQALATDAAFMRSFRG